jgi:hypothetical protein
MGAPLALHFVIGVADWPIWLTGSRSSAEKE